MTKSPTAMGTETPTKVDCWRAGPVEGTKLPRRMPMAIARMIQTTRKRSRKERALRGGTSCVSLFTADSVVVSVSQE